MATKTKKAESNGRLSLNGDGDHEDKKARKGQAESPGPIEIPKLLVHTLKFGIRGITPLLVCKFDLKVQREISEKMEGKAKNKKAPKDPEKEWNAARHVSTKGWDGIHAGGFRAAIIDAARSVDGLTMTELKQAVFVEADGYSKEGTPLVKITKGDPKMHSAMCRTTTGVAYPRYRPVYEDWESVLTLRINGHILTPEAAANLVSLAGFTCGVCEWRPTSPKSKTGDFGRFEIVGQEDVK